MLQLAFERVEVDRPVRPQSRDVVQVRRLGDPVDLDPPPVLVLVRDVEEPEVIAPRQAGSEPAEGTVGDASSGSGSVFRYMFFCVSAEAYTILS